MRIYVANETKDYCLWTQSINMYTTCFDNIDRERFRLRNSANWFN